MANDDTFRLTLRACVCYCSGLWWLANLPCWYHLKNTSNNAVLLGGRAMNTDVLQCHWWRWGPGKHSPTENIHNTFCRIPKMNIKYINIVSNANFIWLPDSTHWPQTSYWPYSDVEVHYKPIDNIDHRCRKQWALPGKCEQKDQTDKRATALPLH